MLVESIFLLALAGSPQADAASPSQLVEALQHADWRTKYGRVLEEARETTRHLDDAAIRALAKELQHVIGLQLHDVPAETYPEAFDFVGYRETIAEILARERNPLAIDALVGVVSNGGLPYSVVRDFGALAVPALIASARSDHGFLGHVYNSLDILEQILETPALTRTLTPELREQIRQVAAERFEHPGSTIGWRVLISAAYLGIATGDPRLRMAAAALVDNPAGLKRRGMTDPRDIDRYSLLTKQALAKMFPSP